MLSGTSHLGHLSSSGHGAMVCKCERNALESHPAHGRAHVPSAFQGLQRLRSQPSVAQVQLIEIRVGGSERTRVNEQAIEVAASDFGETAAQR
jgi:hypothetical protein